MITSRFNLRKATFQMAFLAVMTFVGACSNNPTGVTSQSAIPSKGETFLYQVYTTDTAGNVVLGSERDRTMSVTATGMTIYGKSDVIAVDFQGQQSRTYLHYEDNGDVSVATPGENSTICRWVTLPFASARMSTWPSSVAGLDGIPYSNIGDTAWYGGEMDAGFGPQRQNCTVAGYIYTSNEENSTNGLNGPVRMEKGYWFSPGIGFFRKISSRRLSIERDGTVYGGAEIEVWELKSIAVR